jgi:hypothetical protein
MVMTD